MRVSTRLLRRVLAALYLYSLDDSSCVYLVMNDDEMSFEVRYMTTRRKAVYVLLKAEGDACCSVRLSRDALDYMRSYASDERAAMATVICASDLLLLGVRYMIGVESVDALPAWPTQADNAVCVREPSKKLMAFCQPLYDIFDDDFEYIEEQRRDDMYTLCLFSDDIVAELVCRDK